MQRFFRYARWGRKVYLIFIYMIRRVFGIILLAPGVCSDQKKLHGCGPGSQREKFMKKHCRKTCGLCPMLVLVTGGWGEDRKLDTVELLNMDGTWNCPMPAMPKPRSDHTQIGPIVCGGNVRKSSCISFIRGSVNWKKTHTLAEGRPGNSAWDSPQGIRLLGGWNSGTTSEILLENGDTKPGFNVHYYTA